MTLIILALAAAGCAAHGHNTGSLAGGRGATIALVSIDGPPSDVFHKFVRTLGDEAATRHVAVVPPGSAAQYRLRGYVAAHRERGTTSVAWVWDVYDADQRRALRLRGEERTGSKGGGPWAAVDDEVLRRMARRGMEQLASFVASAAAPPGPTARPAITRPERSLWSLAGLDDFRPEAWGIVRVFRSESETTAAAADEVPQPADVPLPRHRPAPADTGSAVLAYALPRR